MKYEDVENAIEAVCNGDTDAFAIVIENYHVPVRAMIGALVNDRHDADDLAQQTFVYAFQNIDKYQSDTNFLAWMKAIGRTKVMAHFRDYSRSQTNLQDYRKQQILLRSSKLTGSAMDRRLEALGRCIEQLPKERHELLKQVNSRESTLEDLAQKLGRSGVAVRKQVSRIYDALRMCIDNKLKSNEV